jgi:hypothetical protein
MAEATAARQKPEQELLDGFTHAEQKFVHDLEVFLTNYHDFAGETPFERALAATFQVKLGILREGKLPPELEQTAGLCLCYDPVRHIVVLCKCS